MPTITCTCSCILSFFFSSKRRHTRLVSDWSSDVCSSDLLVLRAPVPQRHEVRVRHRLAELLAAHLGGRSEERRVGKSVDIGGGRSIKKKHERWKSTTEGSIM